VIPHLVAAAAGGRLMWYLTRGSGAVALVLLTVAICFGVSGLVSRGARMPRFALADLHRNVSLLALVFLVAHVGTTLADSYVPISIRDAFIPFLSPYRPVWLGFGAVAFDLVLALIATSLLRVRLGLRTWRMTHWFAYACWPVALLHALGTGSDPRARWLQLLAAGCACAVLAAGATRLARSATPLGRRLAAAGAVVALVAGALAWYEHGPGASGWAARAGTPASLLRHTTGVRPAAAPAAKTVTLPTRFSARLRGVVSQSSAGDGLVDVHLDSSLAGAIDGSLRVVLEGVPLDDGGVSMTASGVAFAARGTQVFEGRITALQGTRVEARVRDGSGRTLDLVLELRLTPASAAFAGTVRGSFV
jgi:ferric reductase like protein